MKRDYEEPRSGEGALEQGLPSRFDKDFIMTDEFFVAEGMSATQVQAFLENSPYDGRSWLADHQVNGAPASAAIASQARAAGLNPLVLLSRMQIEMSYISKRPKTQQGIDYALGCGCPDSRRCDASYRGLDKQLACAGKWLNEHYTNSQAGEGAWRKGAARTSKDGYRVVPESHATAALYAYTPWVYNGGNELVWKITARFAVHAAEIAP